MIGHCGLARQPVVLTQEQFCLSTAAQSVTAAPNLDDAFVARALPIARGGHEYAETVGAVEQRAAWFDLAALASAAD
jgi:hypothetical protein